MIVFLVIACSTKKDKLLNRSFHALSTKFNVNFNGEEAFKEGVLEVEKEYYDDFSEILPVEPFSYYVNETTVDFGYGEDDKNAYIIGKSYFDRAEEKATKAIQKHSMLIGAEEKNNQIDEAYLLLGKSRYYTKRFMPALEAFEYIIKNHRSASLIYETVIWRAKANIHIGNVDFSIRALDRIIGATKLPGEIHQSAELALAMAYQAKKDSLDMIDINKVEEHLLKATQVYGRGQSTARSYFILGQIAKEKENIPLSDEYFNKVIETSGALYKFKLRARMELINNHAKDDYEFTQKELSKFIKKYRNKPYLGMLYYEQGLVNQANDSVGFAQESYRQSVGFTQSDVYQRGLAHEKLGDIAFDQRKYQTSKAYYDTIIQSFDGKKSPRIKRLQKKSTGLKKVVDAELNAERNDSILTISVMDSIALNQYFAHYIDEMKEREARQRKKEQEVLKKQNNNLNLGNNTGWYFYNDKARLVGKKEFQEKWGYTQKNKNWYLTSLVNPINTDEEENKDKAAKVVAKGEENAEESKKLNKYDVEYYTQKVNKDPIYLDSITRQRNLNYYELGNVYYDKLGEADLATQKLKQLLDVKIQENLRVAAYYKLYSIYNEESDKNNAVAFYNKLQSEYPQSPFTALISEEQNPEQNQEETLTPEDCYAILYDLYKSEAYESAKIELESAAGQYAITPLAPKIALLKAYILAKLEGKEAFYKSLSELRYQYPNTKEAKKASELLKNKK